MLGSATEPKMAAKVGKFANHTGRRVLTSAPSGENKGGKAGTQTRDSRNKDDSVRNKPKFSADASIEEIDKLLEADAEALINIKKEIGHSQYAELEKLKESIMSARKEHDALLVANNIRERECQTLWDNCQALMDVDRADATVVEAARGEMDSLSDQTSQVLDDLAAEQRTIKMQTLMTKRLDAEIGKCRVESARAQLALDQARHDMVLAEAALQANRQDLLDQETAYEKLQGTLKARKDQREQKITMLTSMSLEGETSVIKLQASLQETARRSAALRSRKASTRGKVGTAKGRADGMDDEFAEDEDDLVVAAKRLTATQLREAVQRYLSQAQRIEKLQQQDGELRANLTVQQRKKKELADHLAQTQFKIQQLASSRQIYQEVDLKDSALAATSKACEDAKERDFRLRLSLEEARQAIPRFLTKVTKVVHPVPSENQLGDAVLKLEDEITKLIKVINMALLKDASADDLAMMGQQSGGGAAGQPAGSGGTEANSEFGRLQRLPGYSRMQRQLFFNLMTARPDVSEENIRIDQRAVAASKPPGQGRGAVEASPRARKLMRQDSAASLKSGEFGALNYDDLEEMSLDRDTIKNISKLIFDRDQARAAKTADGHGHGHGHGRGRSR